MNSETLVNPKVILLITRQLNEIQRKSPEGIKVHINEADILDIQADISGPEGTPYKGGIFRCKLCIPCDFPKQPPKGFFITKIFHPNISEKGEICVNTLKKDWNPIKWSIYNILEVIKCLLIAPFPESALNEDAGKLLMENYDQYFKHAKIITEIYAIPKQERKMEICSAQKPSIDRKQYQQQQEQQQIQTSNFQSQQISSVQLQYQQQQPNLFQQVGSIQQISSGSLNNSITLNKQFSQNQQQMCSPQKENEQKMIEEPFQFSFGNNSQFSQSVLINMKSQAKEFNSNLLLENNSNSHFDSLQAQFSNSQQSSQSQSLQENPLYQNSNNISQNNFIWSSSSKKQKNIPFNFSFTTNFTVPLQHSNSYSHSYQNNSNNFMNSNNIVPVNQQIKKENEKKKWLKRI